MDDPGLNENHLRRLAVSMAMVDAAVVRILDLLDHKPSPARLNVVEPSLSAADTALLREALHKLQPLAEKLARDYGLETHRRDLRRIVAAETSQMWTILENCRPRRMKGLGKVPALAAHQLDQRLDEMISILERMNRTFAGPE
ncbi:MAG TPA: hypothetical protein VNK82_00120 [Terriglobales bacterium]|nr:hypothetical protein [Terriglobales bacterium]